MDHVDRVIEYVLRGGDVIGAVTWLIENGYEDTLKWRQHAAMMRQKERENYQKRMSQAQSTKLGKKSGVGKSGERPAAGALKTVAKVDTSQAGREWGVSRFG